MKKKSTPKILAKKAGAKSALKAPPKGGAKSSARAAAKSNSKTKPTAAKPQAKGRTISAKAKAERADYLVKRLEELYPDTPVPLDHKDPYTLLIAVLLSAQCTDKRVNQITPLLFAKADTPEEMVKLSVEEIQEIIRPCGLSPMKSKGVWGLSRILLDKHGGQVPADLEALEELPAVGHKTAQVVLAQSFGIPSFPVDTHIHRLATRWKLTSGKNVQETEKDLKSLFAEKHWNKLHLQIIFYGREHCTARGCDGSTCQICATFVNSLPKV